MFGICPDAVSVTNTKIIVHEAEAFLVVHAGGGSKCVVVACAWKSAVEATATLLLCAWCAVGKNFIVVNPLFIRSPK